MSFPLQVYLAGEYQDAYLYKNRLYLWTINNDLRIVNWGKLIADFADKSDALILRWGFARNDFLRSAQFREMMKDKELAQEFSRKLLDVDTSEIVIDESDLAKYALEVLDNTVEDMTDVLFYRDVLYMGSASGVYGRRNANTSEPLSASTPVKLSDLYAVSISAKYRTLNGACCEEGLFCWSTIELHREPRQVYRVSDFVRGTMWLRSDFLTLGEDTINYYVNRRRDSDEVGGLAENGDSDSGDENSIVQYGVEVLDEGFLLREAETRLAPQVVFTYGNSVWMCGSVGDHLSLAKWKRPIKKLRFQQEGLVDRVSYGNIYSNVFAGAAIDNQTVILDTENGSMVYGERVEPYRLTEKINVGMRVFSDSRWYVNLACSVQEDHIAMSSIWPLDPLKVLNPDYESWDITWQHSNDP